MNKPDLKEGEMYVGAIIGANDVMHSGTRVTYVGEGRVW